MGWKIAEAFVEISSNLAPWEKGLARVRTDLNGMVASAGSFGAKIGAALAGGGLAVGLYKAVNAASDLGEALNLAKVTFGDSSGDVITAAEVMARAFGTSKKEFLDGAAGLGLIAKASGVAEKDAAGMAIEFANLASDLASIRNIGFDEALQKIRSGLVGEAEPLRTVGVLLSETAVQAEAARKGLDGMSEAGKVAARASLIRQQLGYAKGDREATKDSPANVQREAAGRFSNALESLGQGLMPVWQELIGQANHAMKALGSIVEANLPTLQSWASSVSEAVQFVVTHFRTGAAAWLEFGTTLANSQMMQAFASGVTTAFQSVWSAILTTETYLRSFLINAGQSFEYTQTVLKQFAINAVEGFYWLMDAAGQFGSWLAGNWTGLLRDAFNGAWTIAQNALTNIVNLVKATWDYISNPSGGFNFDFTPMLEGFKATVAELPQIAAPAFTSLQGELDSIMGKMVDRNIEHMQEIAKVGAEVAGVVKPAGEEGPTRTAQTFEGGPAKEKKDKDKSEFVGLADFAKRIQSGVFGKDKAADDTAKNTGRMAGLMQKLVDKADAGPQPAVAVGPA